MDSVTTQRISQAISDIKAGRIVILADDEGRENEGDMVMAAEKITPETMNFMIRQGSGIVCLSMPQDWLRRLELPLMVEQNCNHFGTAFTISIEAKKGVSTGVSANDRVTTIMAAIDDHAKASDLARPGHVFPLMAKNGGVLERRGHTEGSVDLMRLAGLKPAAVLCELMNPDGSMARMPDILYFAKVHNLTVLTIQDIIAFRTNQIEKTNEWASFN